jgi:hypothetical protein
MTLIHKGLLFTHTTAKAHETKNLNGEQAGVL